jgi:hypothetical protein
MVFTDKINEALFKFNYINLDTAKSFSYSIAVNQPKGALIRMYLYSLGYYLTPKLSQKIDELEYSIEAGIIDYYTDYLEQPNEFTHYGQTIKYNPKASTHKNGLSGNLIASINDEILQYNFQYCINSNVVLDQLSTPKKSMGILKEFISPLITLGDLYCNYALDETDFELIQELVYQIKKDKSLREVYLFDDNVVNEQVIIEALLYHDIDLLEATAIHDEVFENYLKNNLDRKYTRPMRKTIAMNLKTFMTKAGVDLELAKLFYYKNHLHDYFPINQTGIPV